MVARDESSATVSAPLHHLPLLVAGLASNCKEGRSLRTGHRQLGRRLPHRPLERRGRDAALRQPGPVSLSERVQVGVPVSVWVRSR
jgi:hypothetical protein